VIVVDGGSTDGTLEVAHDHEVRTLAAHPGRGVALSIGARASHGEVLLFLHADSTSRPGALDKINGMLSTNPRIIGGNFRLIFDGDTCFSRWLTTLCAWIRLIGLYYGDSGIFVHHDASKDVVLRKSSSGWIGYTCCSGWGSPPAGWQKSTGCTRHQRSAERSREKILIGGTEAIGIRTENTIA